MAGLIPDSFALNGSGNVVLQNPEPTPQGSGTQMGGPVRVASTQAATAPVAPASNFGQIAQADMKTLDTLNKLAGGILQPLIAQQQKRQYYEGMSEVAQGRALQGIEKEHPWYLDIFGPSATVRGAQAMTAMTAITQAQSQFLEQMPTLRTQSPDQVRQFLVNQASSLASTGDGTVDTLIQAKLAEAWGPMLETHMKQHVAWMQQDMVQKQVNMNLSNAQNLAAQRQAHGGVGWDPIDQARAYAGVVNAAAPAPGQNQQSWSKGMVSAMRGALQNGNFDFYNAIKGSELWGKIDPTARENLEYMMPLFVQKNALSNPLTKDITSDTAGLSFALQHGVSGIHSADQLDTTIADMNARYSKLTGSVDPLINNVQAAAMHKAWLAGNLSMAKAAAALQAKQDNYNTSGLLVGQAFNSGRWDMLKGLPINQRAAAQFMDMAFDQAAGSNDPGKLQTFFAKASQASNDPLLRSQKLTNIFKTQIAPLVSGTGPMTDQQKQALNYAQLMYQTPTGQAALVNYLGDDAPKVVALLHSGADLSDPKELGAAREAIAKGWAAVPNKAEKVAAQRGEQRRPGLVHSHHADHRRGWRADPIQPEYRVQGQPGHTARAPGGYVREGVQPAGRRGRHDGAHQDDAERGPGARRDHQPQPGFPGQPIPGGHDECAHQG